MRPVKNLESQGHSSKVTAKMCVLHEYMRRSLSID